MYLKGKREGEESVAFVFVWFFFFPNLFCFFRQFRNPLISDAEEFFFIGILFSVGDEFHGKGNIVFGEEGENLFLKVDFAVEREAVLVGAAVVIGKMECRQAVSVILEKIKLVFQIRVGRIKTEPQFFHAGKGLPHIFEIIGAPCVFQRKGHLIGFGGGIIFLSVLWFEWRNSKATAGEMIS